MNKFIKKSVLSFIILFQISISLSAQHAPITPVWAFKHVVWEDSINTADAATDIVNRYINHNIPVGAVIIDSPWTTAYNDFNWDTQRYPEPTKMIQSFKEKNVKVILWLTGAVNIKCKDTPQQKSDTYDYVFSHKLGINESKAHQWWKGTGIHIDFTNPEAKAWWYKQLDKVFIDGVYGWKVDQGEFWFGDTIQTSIGSMTNEQFRPYYYDAMYDYTVAKNANGIVISRPYSHQGGYFASVSKMNMGWCGDFYGDWKGLKLQISNIYTSAKKGYGAPACEIAGFFGSRSNKEELIRYIQFGSMTASMINGGENGAFTNHLPWYHGKETEDIYRASVVLHHELIPYLFSTVVDAHLNGGSLLKVISEQEESHQIGECLFTKAITAPGGKVEFSLPNGGKWVDFWSNEQYSGGKKISKQYSLDKFPLFVKAGSIIPLSISSDITGIGNSTMINKKVFLIYPEKGVKSSIVFHAPKDEGIEYSDISINYDATNSKLSIMGETVGATVFIFRNINAVRRVKNASAWKYNSKTRTLIVESNKSSFQLMY